MIFMIIGFELVKFSGEIKIELVPRARLELARKKNSEGF